MSKMQDMRKTLHPARSHETHQERLARCQGQMEEHWQAYSQAPTPDEMSQAEIRMRDLGMLVDVEVPDPVAVKHRISQSRASPKL